MKKQLKWKSVVTTVLVPLAVTLGIVTAFSDVFAQASHTYTGVTQAVFNCITSVAQNKKRTAHWTGDYDGWAEYTEGNAGMVWLKSTKTLYTEPADLNFEYDSNTGNIKYTIKRMSPGVEHSDIWGGFNGTMIKCKGNAN